MIDATAYILRCEDKSFCERVLTDTSRFRLIDDAKAAGWQLGVKLSGEQAIRGGKDYCPWHRHENGRQ